MCSLARRDGRKGVGLGFDLPRHMGDDDLCINPDTDLSYIDEKIESVLGHFQKDFEDDITPEKLGAVYGGYGSFLPMYQRSPPCSYPISASRTESLNSHKRLHMEDELLKYAVAFCASQAKCNLNSAKSVPPPALALPSGTNSAKENVCKQDKSDFIPKSSDQKMLKVTIKVGSDNLSAGKNAEIYSGLGLVSSPSSSLDESPAESDGFCQMPQVPHESPTSILQMMTSFPVHGGSLLSPLSDELLSLAERTGKSESLCIGSQNIPDNMSEGHIFVKNGEKDLVNKKTMPVKKNGFLLKMENGSRKYVKNGVTCKKKSDIDPMACENLKSNTLKLPILASSFCSTGGTDASFGDANPDLRREKLSSDLKKGNLLEPMPSKKHCQAEKPIRKPVSAKKINSRHAISNSLSKDAIHNAETNSDHIKTISNATKEGKLLSSEPLGPAKMNQEVAFYEQGNFDVHDGKDPSFSKGKKKSKDCEFDISFSDVPTENLRVDSRMVTKKRKTTNANDDLPKKKQNLFRKSSEQLFEGIKFREDDREIRCLKKSTDGRNVSKDNFCGNNIRGTSKLKSSLEVASYAMPMNGNGNTLSPDNWVCCDKCGKWRLLPTGRNPESFPKEWECRMLDWLPGKNSCSIIESETSELVTALNQGVVLGSQVNESCNGLEAVPVADVGNMRCKLKEMSPDTSHDVHSHISKHSMKNLHENAQVNKSFSSPTEKHKYKRNLNYEISEQFSYGGDDKKLKFKTTKAIGHVCSDSGLHTDLRNNLKHKECSTSKSFEGDANPNLRKQNKQALVSVNGKMAEKIKLDISGIAKKRKENDLHPPQYGKGVVKEEACGNKKTRLLKCEGRKLGATKSNGFIDNKVDTPLQTWESLKNDIGSRQPSVVANSSSSKVSDSHKTKARFQEPKLSPVGSVSSSPFIKSNPGVSTSTKKNFVRNPDSHRCLDGEGECRRDLSAITTKDKIANATYCRPPEYKDMKVKQKHVPGLTNHDCGGDATNNFHTDELGNDKHCDANGSLPIKFRMGSSSQSRDNEYCKIPIADSANEYQDCSLQERAGEDKRIIQENIPSSSDMVGRNCVGRTSNIKSEKLGNGFSRNAVATPHQNQMLDHDIDIISKRSHLEISDRAELALERRNLPHLPPSGRPQQTISGSQKIHGLDLLPCGASDGHGGLLSAKHSTKVNNMMDSRQPIPNGNRSRDIDLRTPARKDSTIQAVVSGILEEATNLKHMADRKGKVQSSESNIERTILYFQAALKFMHGASLMESFNTVESMKIYSSTANLCWFCAREYEKVKDMGAAALAYKCMEVAYMRVTYTSHGTAGSIGQELQLALQVAPPGESPSSCASDVDNMNNLPTAEKLPLVKNSSSPHVASNIVITPHQRDILSPLLTFVGNVNLAMDALRKSHIAFAAAEANLEGSEYKDAIFSIRAAIDFNCHDVERLLRLIRLALEAFSNR